MKTYTCRKCTHTLDVYLFQPSQIRAAIRGENPMCRACNNAEHKARPSMSLLHAKVNMPKGRFS